jgi:hypothetical protein
MRKQIIFAYTLLFISNFIFSQDNKSSNNSIGQSSFFAEAGGPGVAFSANIDRRFNPGRLGWGGRVGVGFVSAWDDYYDPTTGTYYSNGQKSAITFPIQLNYIFGKENSNHTFEAGAGLTYVTKKLEFLNFWDDKRTQLLGTFSFMYRRQPKGGGFSWRAGFTPLIGKSYIQAFGAASVGYNF